MNSKNTLVKPSLSQLQLKPDHLVLRHHSMMDWLTCPRLYYYRWVRKLQLDRFHLSYFVGRLVHVGVGLILQKQKDALDRVVELYKQERQVALKKYKLSPDDEQDLNEVEYILQGMLQAYRKIYSKFIRDATSIGTEVHFEMPVKSNVTLVGTIDNLVHYRKKLLLHELKTAKYLTMDYVQAIQTDQQTAIYFHGYNTVMKEKLNGILYSVIRKPSIRQKKTETYQEYLKRLDEWYGANQDGQTFFMEQKPEPLVTKEALLNTVHSIATQIQMAKTKADHFQNFSQCYSKHLGRCEFYDLCYNGETPENLALYTPKEEK